MSKKTLVNISNNIISSESLLEKIKSADIDTTITADKLRLGRIVQDKALTEYIKGISKGLKKGKFSRQVVYKPLEPNRYTFIYPNYDFLSVYDKQLLLLRTSINRDEPMSSKSLLETINSILPQNVNKLNLPDIVSKFRTSNYLNEEDIVNFIDGRINNPIYNKSGGFDKLDGVSFSKTHKFFSIIANIISKIININILFILPVVVSQDIPTSKSLILSDIIENRSTIGIVISIPSLHQVSLYKKSKIPPNTIFFDNIFELNYKQNSLNYFIGPEITKKIIIENGLNIPNTLFVNQTSDNDEIAFEPLDRKQPLKIVEILGPDNMPKKYLLGIYGNLYEDDNKYNDLVGKLNGWDILDGKAKVFWCNNYYKKLKN